MPKAWWQCRNEKWGKFTYTASIATAYRSKYFYWFKKFHSFATYMNVMGLAIGKQNAKQVKFYNNGFKLKCSSSNQNLTINTTSKSGFVE